MSVTEFSIPQKFKTNRKGPIRWVLSHAVHNWYLILIATLGALLNAALMSVTPKLVGNAYNLITAPNARENLENLGVIALMVGGTQLIRGGMQMIRNLGFELVAQRTERNVREELYINLLGKSMTFHSLQPVGDTMARATNDVRQVNFFFSPA